MAGKLALILLLISSNKVCLTICFQECNSVTGCSLESY
jgi:hypothetical protein